MTGRLRLALVGVLAALALPLAATAGGQPAFHVHEVFTFTDPNFCGTGAPVAIADDVNAIVWIGETGGDPTQDVKVAFNVATTFTNPATGASLVGRFAGVNTNEIVIGLESGPHTHEFVENGLRAKLKLPNGGLLTRDAGSLTYRVSFDAADNVVGFELVSVHGPHPAFDSPVWCEAAIAALGL
jgi:hypothetical protein